MTSRLTPEEALALLAEAFNEPANELHAGRLRDSIAGWDSMGALLVIAELDERFGIELSADESRRMLRVGDFLDFMRKHGLLQE